MEIQVAKSAGFCLGVRRAIEVALETAGKNRPVVMLGDIVHNEQVVQQIAAHGVTTAQTLAQVGPQSTLLLRAHGARPEVYEDARNKGVPVVDATCPFVTEIHQEVRELHKQGCHVVIIGDHGHDEVLGIAGQVPQSTVISRPEEVVALKKIPAKIGVVVQSTQNIENVSAIMAELVRRSREIQFRNTICGPTIAHQRDIRQMPLDNEVMVIIGSKSSANTKRLVEISLALNPATHFVQTADDLEPRWFSGVKKVGVSAGASTPDTLIEAVVARIREIAEGRETSPDTLSNLLRTER